MGGKGKERVDALVRAGAAVLGFVVWWRGRRVARMPTGKRRGI